MFSSYGLVLVNIPRGLIETANHMHMHLFRDDIKMIQIVNHKMLNFHLSLWRQRMCFR